MNLTDSDNCTPIHYEGTTVSKLGAQLEAMQHLDKEPAAADPNRGCTESKSNPNRPNQLQEQKVMPDGLQLRVTHPRKF